MSIHRSITVIDNDVLEDRRLSYLALGLYCYLAGKDFGVEAEDIPPSPGESAAEIKEALAQLERCGYITQTTER